MSGLQLLGLGLLLSPFIAITAWIIYDLGVVAVVQIWGMTLLICGTIALGVALLTASP